VWATSRRATRWWSTRPWRRWRRSWTTAGLSLPRLFFKQIEIIGSTMGSYPEFAQVTRLVAQGLPVTVDEVFELADYPAALERLRLGAQLGKIVLRHTL
jgi:D-arabinose 1-dehydrogenase-like Zn-dependent alcohol dehydrogenase